MTDLSPAAQAVKNAVIALYTDQQQIRDWGWRLDAPTAAAALRAAADQVVPIDRRPWWLCNIRRDLLAIAAELEAQQ
jgi:hypothetical protein